MAMKHKKKQDIQKYDEEFVDLPEDRLGQIEHAKSKETSEKKIPRKPSSARKKKQALVSKEASRDVDERAKSLKDDLLADVRRSLADEEVVEAPKGIFGRIKARLKKPPKSKGTDVEIEPHKIPETETVTIEDLRELVVDSKPKRRSSRNKEEQIAIQEFFADLEAMADVELDVDIQSTPELKESKSDGSQLEEKVRVPKIPSKPTTEVEIDIEAVREVALQEYDETKIEPEIRKPSLREEMRQTIRELRPLERILLIIFGIVTVGVLFSSGIFLIVNSITIPTPIPTVEIDPSEIIHPTRITLPGGWAFNLGQGRVMDGNWIPGGAEWLVGTEISRWVALPWSLQLEAVLRTLKSEDQIQLSMSNFEEITFNVYSIQKMTMGELLATDPTTPSLLIVLYGDEEEDGSYWVVTSIP